MSLNLTTQNLAFLTAIFIPILSYLLYKAFPYIQPLWLPLRRTNQHGGDLVAQVLKEHNVKWVFTLIGGHVSPILVAAQNVGIKVVDVRSECTTVFAADAVSRLSDTMGVAIVTAGPGVTNTITAMKNAQMAQSPLVLIGGAAATLLKGRGSLQDVEQIDVLRSIVKYHASIRHLREIVPIMRRAFYEAMHGVPGPVFVEIPIDCLYPIGECMSGMGLTQCVKRKDLKPSTDEYKRIMVPFEFMNKSVAMQFDANLIDKYVSKQSADQSIFIDIPKKKLPPVIDIYLRYQTRYLFAGAFDTKYNCKPIQIPPMLPDIRSVNRLIELLLQCNKPCIIISSQALLNSEKANDIQKAVETLSIATFLSSMARGLLGRNHKLYIKQGRTKALRDSDLIILCGTMVDFRLDYGRVLNRKAKIIAINRSYSDLKLNSDLFWKPSMTLQCDPGRALLMIAQQINTATFKGQYKNAVRDRFAAWTSGLKAKEEDRERANETKALGASYPRPALHMKQNASRVINPVRLCMEIEKHMDDNSIIIVDGGDFAATAAYVCRPRGPLKWLDPGPFGTLGVGAGFVLGAKLVNPSAEIWLIWGDGSSGYSIAEIDTFRRFGIGVICVIGNDACWSQIEREQVPKLGSNVACMLSYCKYHTVSQGYGGDGELIYDNKQLTLMGEKNPFFRAKQYVKKHNAPYVINAHIGTSDFREGSISV
eukprot:31682_1